MNIALVILRADPARGGAERYTVDLAAALAARGHSVSVLSSEFGEGIPGVNFVELPAKAPTRRGRYLRFLDGLDNQLRSARYEIVHAMLPVPACDVYHPHAGLAADAMDTGHLKHGSAAVQMLARLGTRLNRKRAKFAEVEKQLLTAVNPPLVLCLSQYVQATILQHYPALVPRLRTLFNAVDLHRFNPAASHQSAIRARYQIATDEVVALMIAQDFARKGLSQTLAAIAQLDPSTRSKLRLLVVGKQDPQKYQALARQLDISDRVIFAGVTAAPEDFYRAADFFVLPTRHDPCSLVVLESLAMGVPVISTVFNGACEIMQDGRHGCVLKDPADIPALAEAMKLMMDADRRVEMRQACLALRTALSFETHISRLESIYELS